jgi:putative (di)nucleoside polyphosphate hydrolase
MSLSSLPYRRNVGAVLFNAGGQVFVAKRKDLPDVWQLPQGGIDKGEDPAEAVFRELKEEIGTNNATILGEHPAWLRYDLPAHLQGVAWHGKYRGQEQKWFALRFTGRDADIDLEADSHPEFTAFKWIPLADLATLEVGFKRPIYQTLAQDFARFSAQP